jgi:uncharacterized integral membrane protein (TIGR00698 family)
MPFTHKNRHHTINGIFFTCLFALSSYYIAEISWIKNAGFSPLVIAVVLGMIYGSTLRSHLPHEWTPGIQFVAKRILRLAVVFYGFRLTFQQVMMVGLDGFILDLLIVALTMIIGTFIGIKCLKMDRDTSILVSSGSAICGAAAVLATEGTLKSEPHKAAVGILSVVLFGTTAMFLYTFMQHIGWLGLSDTQYGIYVGATVHEVAQVVVAGSSISADAGNIAVIVKMTRVMLLAPMLIILGFCLMRGKSTENTSEKKPIWRSVPLFAVLFVAVVGFNSFELLPTVIISGINQIDTFLLTLAMAGLGIETNLRKVKEMGMKPLYLALILFIWLIVGGYWLNIWLL